MSDPFSTFLNTSGAIHQTGFHSAGPVSGPFSEDERGSLLELLHHLSDQAEQHAARITDMYEFRETLRLSEDEVRTSHPDFARLNSLLETLYLAVESVSPLAAIASAIRALIAARRV